MILRFLINRNSQYCIHVFRYFWVGEEFPPIASDSFMRFMILRTEESACSLSQLSAFSIEECSYHSR